MVDKLDWAWKDPDNKEAAKVVNKPKPIFGKKRRKKARKQARKNLNRLPGTDFYVSKEWRKVRYRVIQNMVLVAWLAGGVKRFTAL